LVPATGSNVLPNRNALAKNNRPPAASNAPPTIRRGTAPNGANQTGHGWCEQEGGQAEHDRQQHGLRNHPSAAPTPKPANAVHAGAGFGPWLAGRAIGYLVLVPANIRQTCSLAASPAAQHNVSRSRTRITGERSTMATNAAKNNAPEVNPQALEELRKSDMMAHLLDALDAGKDIGHYGRLVFAMVARHFLSDDELVGYLTKDPDFAEGEARMMVSQVQGRDYNPPRREKILEYQQQQEFPIIPNPDDPDSGNVYRTLNFPSMCTSTSRSTTSKSSTPPTDNTDNTE
jgi:hypothetical protein